MNFIQQIDVHAAGQGLFYSGSAVYRNYARFDFVFDCGSEDKDDARREIARYRHDVLSKNDRLNMLVISHFDADHVNLIHELLAGGIIVDRLVMPFITFEERLYLILEQIAGAEGYDAGAVYRLTLDPVSALGDNLDGDSEIYLIESDPDPIPAPGEDNIVTDNFQGRGNVERLDIDFPGSVPIDAAESSQGGIPKSANTYLVKDNQKSVVNAGSINLMEFLFYKKSLGPKDKAFFEAVAKGFFNESKIDRHARDLTERIVGYISNNYRSATEVKKIFEDAKKKSGLGRVSVSDLNKTALCLLHRNTKTKYEAFVDYDPVCYHIHHFSKHTQPIQLSPIYYNPSRIYPKYQMKPVVMLTSDGFLKKAKDLKAFKKKYRSYLQECWLVQVPHHGSVKNVTQDFFTSFSDFSEFFINYGTGNRHGHPSKEIFTMELRYFELSPFLVNEFQGFRYAIRSDIK
ncbi:hypothetical protein ACFQZI_20075 [Mucilaginibacter lutimaris]|uniref:Metallo-beta-lactamase superfamily protein n=1 Tax=Mucilaginibacter lutimaris TaxID=931629 RepID=A0ABW2ZLP2_9SPHI